MFTLGKNWNMFKNHSDSGHNDKKSSIVESLLSGNPRLCAVRRVGHTGARSPSVDAGLFCNSGNEDIDMPLREIADNVLQMATDGYSPSRIASFLGIYPSQVSSILKERDCWAKEIKGTAQKQAAKPWYMRWVSRFI